MSEHNRSIITIGRQFGSGGREIGEKLAKELSIPFYDKELIALAGQRSGIDQSLLDDVDEKRNQQHALLSGSGFLHAAERIYRLPRRIHDR